MKLLTILFIAAVAATTLAQNPDKKQESAGLKIIKVDLQRTISNAPKIKGVQATDPASQAQAKNDRLRDADNLPALHRLSKDAEIAPVNGANPHGYIPGGTNPIIYVASIVVKNIGTKTIKSVSWEYLMFEPGVAVPAKRFRVHSKKLIAPGEQLELTKEVEPKGKEHQALITRIEYSDGSSWEQPATVDSAKRQGH